VKKISPLLLTILNLFYRWHLNERDHQVAHPAALKTVRRRRRKKRTKLQINNYTEIIIPRWHYQKSIILV
jgi:hypothetical protein